MRLGRSSKFVVHIIVVHSVRSGAAVIIVNSCGAVRGSGFRQIARIVGLRNQSVLRVRSESVIDHPVSLLGTSLRSYSVIQLVSVRGDSRRQIRKQDELDDLVAPIW